MENTVGMNRGNDNQFLRVCYQELGTFVKSFFVKIEPSRDPMQEVVNEIVADMTECGGIWISKTKIIPLHRVCFYEICNEESKNRIEDYENNKVKPGPIHDRRNEKPRPHGHKRSFDRQYSDNSNRHNQRPSNRNFDDDSRDNRGNR